MRGNYSVAILRNWCHWLRFPADSSEVAQGRPGKPNAVAVMILAELTCTTNCVVERSYRDYVELFGFTYDQVRDAVGLLESEGCVVKTVDRRAGNRMYLEVVPDRVREISACIGQRRTA